jgi:hypothetical protein
MSEAGMRMSLAVLGQDDSTAPGCLSDVCAGSTAAACLKRLLQPLVQSSFDAQLARTCVMQHWRAHSCTHLIT